MNKRIKISSIGWANNFGPFPKLEGKENALFGLSIAHGENQIIGEDMKKESARFEALREGGEVVALSSPLLYPTPQWLAEKMVELADIEDGQEILEPSAGMGAIVEALKAVDVDYMHIMATEIDTKLAEYLREQHSYKIENTMRDYVTVTTADFLSSGYDNTSKYGDDCGYERILMNPPFNKGSDIKHINHALTKLKSTGRLVAICADGPRQREAFQDLATHWETLPAGTFKNAGTNVNTALLIIDGKRYTK